jgi:hypothetical protein
VSDIQDLIHTTTIKAFDLGVQHEQERIIKLLELADSAYGKLAIALIKGETE